MTGRLLRIFFGVDAKWLPGLALLLVLLVPRASAQGRPEGRIWSGILLASQAEKPKAPPAELARLAPKIESFFGYNQLVLLGSATKLIDEPAEQWLVPTQHFSMVVKTKRAPENSYVLQIVLYHDKRMLVETEARLAPDSPLLIRGPMHSQGQLIIALQVLR